GRRWTFSRWLGGGGTLAWACLSIMSAVYIPAGSQTRILTWKGKHEMQRHAQRLGAVHVGKRRRIRDDGVGHERVAGAHQADISGFALFVPRVDARAPEAAEHGGHGAAAPAHVARAHRLDRRYHARVLDREGHELGRVAADREDLDARPALGRHEVPE